METTDQSSIIGLFCGLITDRAKYTAYLDLFLLQMMNGIKISHKEKTTIENIASKLGHVAFETLDTIIDDANQGHIPGIDSAKLCEIKYHTHFWLESTYPRILSWVGVSINRKLHDGTDIVKFYIDNETDNPALHSLHMDKLDLLLPEIPDGHYWWFALRDTVLHKMPYTSQPDIEATKNAYLL